MKLEYSKKDVELVFQSLESYKLEFEDISYFESYFEFVEFFRRIEEIDYHSLVISAYFTYGWMPTILKKFNRFNSIDDVISILNKVKRNVEIDKNEYHKLVTCINNSIVGVSKLLHFINPKSYPIFDSRIKNYFKENSLLELIWKSTNQNKELDIKQYQLYREICLEMISDNRFNKIYEESIQKLSLAKELTKMRVLENLFFSLDKNHTNIKKDKKIEFANIEIKGDNLTIKEKLYIILKNENKPLTEKELVSLYVLKYPNYSENYKLTKTPSIQKIRGTIQSVLQQNTTHELIKTDKTETPYVYYVIK